MKLNIQFLIIGGQKCGSTYIHHILMEHPQIFMPKIEVPFFENPDYYDKNKYHELQKLTSTNNKLVGIKRPNYLSKTEVPERIKNNINNPKFIVILRNPIDRFISAYYHYLNAGFAPLLSINKAISIFREGKSIEQYPRVNELLEFSKYFKYLKLYLEFFNLENFLILFHEDLLKNRLEVIKKCYNFLGIDDNFTPKKSLDQTPQKVNYSMHRARIHRLKNKIRYKYNTDKTRIEINQLSYLDKTKIKILNKIDDIVSQKIIKAEVKPQLLPINREYLLNEFIKDIENLESLLSIDLNHWKK